MRRRYVAPRCRLNSIWNPSLPDYVADAGYGGASRGHGGYRGQPLHRHALYAMDAPSDSSALGAFYTPPAIGQRLLDMATEAGVDWSSARILDPACGGGVFLVAAA